MIKPQTGFEQDEFPSWRRLPQPGEERNWSLSDLLAYHDRAFVRAAYRVVLGRDPEPSAFQSRLEDLRSGRITRVGTLGRIRYSREGRRRGVAVRGLFPRFVADIAGSVPFIGFPVRWLLAILSLPRLRNELEEVAAVDKAQLAELDDRWERVTDLLGKTLNDVSARMAKSQDENIATMLGIQGRSKAESEVRFDSLDKTVQEVAGRIADLAAVAENRLLAVEQRRARELFDLESGLSRKLRDETGALRSKIAQSCLEAESRIMTLVERMEAQTAAQHVSMQRASQEMAADIAALADATEKRFAAMEEERAKELSDLEASFWGDLEREIETLWKALAEANADNASSLASMEQKRAKDLAVFESTVARDIQREAEMLREVILRSRNETESKLAETKQELAAIMSAQAAMIEKTAQEVNGGIEALAASTEKKLASSEKRAAKASADVESSLSERLGRETAERAMKMSELAAKSESALEFALAPFRASAHAVRLEPRLYFPLQEAFRGSREEVKDKLRIYLDPLTSVGAGSSEKPVLDIGCGRGEWLELLKENGFQARGVDESPDALASCVEAGLDVVQNDALEFLRTESAGRYGAVSLIHVAEHLPIGHLVDLLQEARRVLAPGGMLIAETPNPENLLVGAWTFYLDPTHQHPLPARLMSFLAEQAGFTDVRPLMLHPFEEEMRVGSDESELAKRVNEAFYGPRDYAILATKGAENG